jgi:two-component system response regulator AtoC
LESHDWPGNVRQLENTIARMVALSDGGELGVEHWDKWNLGAATPETAAEAQAPEELEDLPPPERALGRPPGFREQVDAFERNLIAQALELAGGNQSEAARRLGLARGTFIERMKKHNLGSDR